MQRTQRSPLFVLAGLLAAGSLLASSADAHDVTPYDAVLRPGATSLVKVEDTSGCTADITVWSGDPTAVRVWALDSVTGQRLPGDGITAFALDSALAYFLIEGGPLVTSTVQTGVRVCWIGSDFPSGNCNENNCDAPALPHFIPVTVEPAPIASGALPFAGWAGDPVKTPTGGQFLERRELIGLGGPLPVGLGIYYDSTMERSGAPAGHMGPGWRNDTDWTLEQVGDGAYEVTTPDGMVVRFQRQPPNWDYQLTPYTEVPFQLARPSPFTDFTLLDPRTNLVYTFQIPPVSGWIARARRVEDGKGNVQTRTTSLNNPVTAISDGRGRQITLGYQGGKLTTIGDGTRTVTLGYDGPGQLSTLTDAANATTSFQYDPAYPGEGQLVSEVRPEGNQPVTSVYDGQRRVVQQTDARNNVTTFVYGTGGVTTVTDALGNDTEHLHSADGRLLEHTDATDATVTMSYDTEGRRTGIVDRNGHSTSWTYHQPSGRVATYTDASGGVTTSTYASRPTLGFDVWDLAGVTYPDGTSESYVRDAQGNVTSYTDRLGNAWTSTYDPSGLPLTDSDPDGNTTTYSYNADGTLASMTDAGGNTTSYTYDALGRLVSWTYPDGSVRSRALDLLGRVLSETDEDGSVSGYTHDRNDNLLARVDPTGATRVYTYDWNDKRSTAADPLGHVRTREYDARNMLAKLLSPTLLELLLSHDHLGAPIAAVDSAGQTWSTGRDPEGAITSNTTPLGHTRSVVNDALGRPVSEVGPRGGVRSVVRNSLGEPIQFIDSFGNTYDWVRDASGKVTSVLAPTGESSSLGWDAVGNPTSITDPAGQTSQFEYDFGSRLKKRTDPLGRVTVHDYDQRGRRVQTTLPASLGQVNFTWTADGQLSQVSGSDGAAYLKVYDGNDRLTGGTGLTRVFDAAGNIIGSNGITSAYDADSKLASYELAPNKTVTILYDAAGRVCEVNDWLGNFVRFVLDADSRVVRELRSSGVNSKYVHDEASNVTAETHGRLFRGFYEFDGENRCTAERVAAGWGPWIPSATSASYSCDAAGQLAGATHDERGRQLDDGTRQCTWNTLGDLTSVSDGFDTVQYGYDCQQRLATREVVGSGTVTSYVWNDACDGGLGVCRENGVDVAYFVCTPSGNPLWSIDAATGGVTWSVLDTRGDLVATTDGAGKLLCTHGYLPFGEPLDGWGGCACRSTYRAAEGWLCEPVGELYLTPDGPCDGTLGRRLQPGPQGFGPMSCNSYGVPLATFAAPGALALPEARSVVVMDTPNTAGIGTRRVLWGTVRFPWGTISYAPSPNQAVRKFSPAFTGPRWPPSGVRGLSPEESEEEGLGGGWESLECGCEYSHEGDRSTAYPCYEHEREWPHVDHPENTHLAEPSEEPDAGSSLENQERWKLEAQAQFPPDWPEFLLQTVSPASCARALRD